MKVKSESEVAQSCRTPSDPMDCRPPGSSFHGDSPGKNTGVGCHACPQGIVPTQGSNLSLFRLQAKNEYPWFFSLAGLAYFHHVQDFAGWHRQQYVQRHRGMNQPDTEEGETRDEG